MSHRSFAAIRRSSLPGGVRRVKPPRSGPVGLGFDAVRGIGTLAGADDGHQFTSLRICDQIRETERARFGLLECRSPPRTAGAAWGGVVGGVLCRALIVRQKVARENRPPLAFIGVAVPAARGPPAPRARQSQCKEGGAMHSLRSPDHLSKNSERKTGPSRHFCSEAVSRCSASAVPS